MAGATGERPATEKQTQVLAAIDAFRNEHGYPPSVREIGERVGLSSSSTIHAHLKALEKRGLISRDPTKPRALRSSSMDQQPIRDSVVLPIVGRVAAGVPITAAEKIEGEFLLSADFVPRASDAFMLRVQGDSMIDAAILDGDLSGRPARSDGRKRRNRGRDARRRGDRQTLLPRDGSHPAAAGESEHGANLRERCRDPRPSRGRRPALIAPHSFAGSSGGRFPSCAASETGPSSSPCARRSPGVSAV